MQFNWLPSALLEHNHDIEFPDDLKETITLLRTSVYLVISSVSSKPLW